MPITIGSNIASLRAQRSLGGSSRSLSEGLQRLSSGLRINRASDDAAGLAIASSLSADARVFTQALRNVNDGVSYLNVVDGASSQLKQIVFRGRELAEQSANGTYSDTQRAALDVELGALQAEYNRILDATSYNGVQVFSSENTTVTLQAGYGNEAALVTSFGLSRQEGATGTAVGDGTFGAANSFANSGGLSFSVAVADVNGDGKDDLINAENSVAQVSVMLGNGDGTFQARTTLSAGSGPRMVAVADLNGDGKLDIVSADGGSSQVSIFLGNGDGSFQARVSYAPGAALQGAAIGDLNGDGKLDLFTPLSGNGAAVLLGNGDGTFQARTSYQTGGGPYAVTLGDFNGDGKLDAAMSDGVFGRTTVLLGNGDGTFQARTTYLTGSRGYSIASADFNSDGKVDLVTADETANCVSVLLGNGNGTFLSRISYSTGANPYSVALSDLNGDGVLDLITADSGGNSVSVLLGNGDGSFQARTFFATGTAPRSVVADDLDGDGVVDLITTGSVTSVLLGNGSPGLQETSALTLSRLGSYSVATRGDALTTLDAIAGNLDELNTLTATVGSWMSRLESVTRTLGATTENVRAAESRIADADVAAESAHVLRSRILQQAAAAVLAQANLQPRISLQLLQGV